MRKINLVYDATSMANHLLNRTGSGIYTVSFEVLKELCHRKGFNISLYCEDNQKETLVKGLRNAPGEFKKLKIFNNKKLSDTDVFFSPMYAIPSIIANQPNIQKYLFLHDAIPLMHHEYWIDLDWYFTLFHSINKNDFYFTNSKSTQNDFMKYNINITEDNSVAVPLACDKLFQPLTTNIKKVLKKYNIPTDKKYVFSLCTLEPRKNLIRAVKTFIEFIKKNKIDDMVFILGGGQWVGFMEQLNAEFDGLGEYKDKILRAGYIDKKDLPAFYSGAEWFVYTSKYEGFGLPPLEAMACGCPVITSNNSSLPEVIGDAGQMIDWDSDEQHITAYEKYYMDEKYRSEMSKKGLERSKEFSWQKTVDIIEKQIKDRFIDRPQQIREKTNKKLNLLFDANLLINATTKSTARSGVFFVVYNVLTQLKKQNNFNLFLWANNNNLKSIVDVLDSDKNLKGLKIASKANLDDMDAFFSPHSDIPDCIIRAGHIRAYKITYDFMGCVFDDKIFSTKLENHQRAMYTCQKQFCISESTKQDYLKFVPETNPDNLIVTLLAASSRFCKSSSSEITKIKKKYGIDGIYILSVCNLAPHKNLFIAIDAFVDFVQKNKIKDLKYVLCGGVPDFYKEDFDKKMQSLGKYAKQIILTGYVDDADVPVLYSGAEFFVFPSLYEGFGLPILEAMQCGTPVVCSNTSSMPEIIGNCGLTVSPENKQDFINAFNQMHSSPNFRNKCSEKGLKRAKNFSWEKMVDVITDTIKTDAKQNNNIYPIVLITDENYVRPTVVAITSILVNKYKNTNYKIYVLGNSLSEKSKILLESIDDCVNVIPFENAFAEFIGTHQHVSAAALLKFKIADIFTQYDKILYLDTDMLIQHDLTDIFETNIKNKYAVVVKDVGCTNSKHNKRLGLVNYFNSGMMLLNIAKMRKDSVYDKLLDFKEKDKDRLFMDQDAFNSVFNDNLVFASPTMNFIPLSWGKLEDSEIAEFFGTNPVEVSMIKSYAKVVHLADKRKPWYYSNVYGSALWAEYYYKSVLRNIALKYKDKVKTRKPLKQVFKSLLNQLLHRKRYIKFNRRAYGKDLQFSKFADKYLTGIGGAEPWGRWSLDDFSEIVLPILKNNKDLHFVFKVRAFALNKILNQNIKVFVNGKHICDWNFVNGKSVPITEFDVPKDLLNKSGLKIRLEYSNPSSPHRLGMGEDRRKLAIGFESIRIIKKKTNLKKPENFLQCNFAQPVSFFSIQNKYLDGFYAVEPWGRWSQGTKSEINLHLERTKQDLHFAFMLNVFALDKILNQKVKVFVNGKEICEWNFVAGKPMPDTEFDIPKKMLNKHGNFKIEFIYSKTISPNDLGLSSDTRLLAIGFESMNITQKQ